MVIVLDYHTEIPGSNQPPVLDFIWNYGFGELNLRLKKKLLGLCHYCIKNTRKKLRKAKNTPRAVWVSSKAELSNIMILHNVFKRTTSVLVTFSMQFWSGFVINPLKKIINKKWCLFRIHSPKIEWIPLKKLPLSDYVASKQNIKYAISEIYRCRCIKHIFCFVSKHITICLFVSDVHK